MSHPVISGDSALDAEMETIDPGQELVVFKEPPAQVPSYRRLVAGFTLGQAVEPSPKDWVGIFESGWQSPKAYSAFQWAFSAPFPRRGNEMRGSRAHRVVFPAVQVSPLEDANKHYQILYVTKTDDILGVSRPFQIVERLEAPELLWSVLENPSPTSVLTLKVPSPISALTLEASSQMPAITLKGSKHQTAIIPKASNLEMLTTVNAGKTTKRQRASSTEAKGVAAERFASVPETSVSFQTPVVRVDGDEVGDAHEQDGDEDGGQVPLLRAVLSTSVAKESVRVLSSLTTASQPGTEATGVRQAVLPGQPMENKEKTASCLGGDLGSSNTPIFGPLPREDCIHFLSSAADKTTSGSQLLVPTVRDQVQCHLLDKAATQDHLSLAGEFSLVPRRLDALQIVDSRFLREEAIPEINLLDLLRGQARPSQDLALPGQDRAQHGQATPAIERAQSGQDLAKTGQMAVYRCPDCALHRSLAVYLHARCQEINQLWAAIQVERKALETPPAPTPAASEPQPHSKRIHSTSTVGQPCRKRRASGGRQAAKPYKKVFRLTGQDIMVQPLGRPGPRKDSRPATQEGVSPPNSKAKGQTDPSLESAQPSMALVRRTKLEVAPKNPPPYQEPPAVFPWGQLRAAEARGAFLDQAVKEALADNAALTARLSEAEARLASTTQWYAAAKERMRKTLRVFKECCKTKILGKNEDVSKKSERSSSVEPGWRIQTNKHVDRLRSVIAKREEVISNLYERQERYSQQIARYESDMRALRNSLGEERRKTERANEMTRLVREKLIEVLAGRQREAWGVANNRRQLVAKAADTAPSSLQTTTTSEETTKLEVKIGPATSLPVVLAPISPCVTALYPVTSQPKGTAPKKALGVSAGSEFEDSSCLMQ